MNMAVSNRDISFIKAVFWHVVVVYLWSCKGTMGSGSIKGYRDPQLDSFITFGAGSVQNTRIRIHNSVVVVVYLWSCKDDVGSGSTLRNPVTAPPGLEPVLLSLNLHYCNFFLILPFLTLCVLSFCLTLSLCLLSRHFLSLSLKHISIQLTKYTNQLPKMKRILNKNVSNATS